MRRRVKMDALRCGVASLVLLASVGSATAASVAGVYRWVDRDGHVHFDDHNTVRGIRVTREQLAARVVAPAIGSGGPVPVEWFELMERECALQRARLAALDQPLQLYGVTPEGVEYRYTEQQQRLFRYETAQTSRLVCAPDAAARAYRAAVEASRQ